MDAIDRVLLACLRRQPADFSGIEGLPLPRADWDLFVQRARGHRVVPLVYRRLEGVPDGVVPPEVLGSLRSRYYRVALRNLRLFAALHDLVASFHKAGIHLLLLKGAYLAPETYGNLSLREMADLDLLVEKTDLAAGVRHLLEAGFRSRSELPDDIADRVSDHHVPRLSRNGIIVELHWRLLPPGQAPPAPMDALWNRAVPVTLAGADALALSLEDLLLHICAHAAYHHRFDLGLRPYCDIRQILETRGGDVRWSVLLERAGVWGWKSGILLALQLAHRLTASPIPKNVLDEAEAAVPRELLRSAEEMALADPRATCRLSRNLIDWQQRSFLGRLHLLWQRFLWRPEHVDPSLGYYVRRGWGFLDHLDIARRLSAGDTETVRLAGHMRGLRDWLTLAEPVVDPRD